MLWCRLHPPFLLVSNRHRCLFVCGLLVLSTTLLIFWTRARSDLWGDYQPQDQDNSHPQEMKEHLPQDDWNSGALVHYTDINRFPTMQLNFRPTLPHERAVVTGLFTDTYAYSAAVLGHSLKRVNIDARMIAMYIPGHVSEESLCLAKSQGWEPQPIERIPPPHNGHNIDPKFVDQYTKLQLWSFDKLGIRSVVFFDADVVVRRPIPIHLFDLPFSFAAVPDGIQSPLINGGGLFLKTDSRIRDDMVIKMETAPFNLAWAEQNFLNLYWGGHVLILPWIFNANIWIKYQSSKLWEGMLDELVALHMTSAKPFPHYDVGGVLTLEEMKVAIEWKFESHRQSEYDFSQELQWWLDEWERMVGDSRSQLTTCVPTSVGNAKTTLMEAGIPFPP